MVAGRYAMLVVRSESDTGNRAGWRPPRKAGALSCLGEGRAARGGDHGFSQSPRCPLSRRGRGRARPSLWRRVAGASATPERHRRHDRGWRSPVGPSRESGAGRGDALVRIAVTRDQARRLGRVFSPNLTSARQTPCSEIRSSPHFSLASSALIRLGRTPGEPRRRPRFAARGAARSGWASAAPALAHLQRLQPHRSTCFFRR